MMTVLLNRERDMEVIAATGDGQEALELIKTREPDVVVLDLVLDYFLRKFQLMGDSPVLQFLSDNRMLIYAIVLILIMVMTWSPKMVEKRNALFGRRKESKEG